MNLPNGYRDETGTSYSDTWVHQDNKNTQSSIPKKGFFSKEQFAEINQHNEWMKFNSKCHPNNRTTFKEWLENNK